jgi:hypothetical protein
VLYHGMLNTMRLLSRLVPNNCSILLATPTGAGEGCLLLNRWSYCGRFE